MLSAFEDSSKNSQSLRHCELILKRVLEFNSSLSSAKNMLFDVLTKQSVILKELELEEAAWSKAKEAE